MSEAKIREEKCSLNSPCKKNMVCDIVKGSCEHHTNNLTFYIKGKGYTGDFSNIIKKVNQEYSGIVNTAKCNMGNKTNIGKTYKDIKKTMKSGDILFFYFPEDNKVLCQNYMELYKTEIYYGIALNSKESKQLRYHPEKFKKRLKDITTNNMLNMFNKAPNLSANHEKGQPFQTISPLVPNVYIKQSQVYNILKQGFNFFVVLPTNMRWLSTERYKNFNPTEHKYGDTLYMVVPISDKILTESKTEKKKIEQKYCGTSYSKYQNILLNKVKELYSDIVADEGNIKQINKKLFQTKVQLESDPNNKILKKEMSKLKSYYKMIEKMRKLKPSEKHKYPYWYYLSNPIGQKLKSIGRLKPFEYNGHLINPVYIGKTEVLVCQSQDMNYEVKLYAHYDRGKMIYSQSLKTLFNHENLRGYYRVPLNKNLQKGYQIRYNSQEQNYIIGLKEIKDSEIPKLLDEKIPSEPVPIYCVKISQYNREKIVYYGTSKNNVEQYYNLTIGNRIKKFFIKIRMNNTENTFSIIKEDKL